MGSADAAHAQYLTAASAAHIRVKVLEENQGLGAELKGEAESTGLGALQDLLGRLNGKGGAEREKEEELRKGLKKRRIVQEKYGRTWVSGGFLQGAETTIVSERQKVDEHRSQALLNNALTLKSAPQEETEREASKVRKAVKAKKRKRGRAGEIPPMDLQQGADEDQFETTKNSLAPYTFAKSKAAEPASLLSTLDKRKKKKKSSRKAGRKDPEVVTQDNDVAALGTTTRNMQNGTTRTEDRSLGNAPPVDGSQAASALFLGGRNAVRRRYIQHKKMAMDPRALNEVSIHCCADLLATPIAHSYTTV